MSLQLVWKLEDFGAAMEEFLRSSDGDAISANCGGHCGGCGPEREMTLQINQKHGEYVLQPITFRHITFQV